MKCARILLTTDFSPTSQEAFAPARDLAEKYGASVLLAHVEEDHLPPLVVEYATVGLEEMQRRQREHALEELGAFVREHFGDVPHEVRVTSGIPHAEIVRLAEEEEIDLIVMATHGRGFISHALLGSTTERVLRRAPCPVLVVRAGCTQEE